MIRFVVARVSSSLLCGNWLALVGVLLLGVPGMAAAEGGKPRAAPAWSFSGPLGHFDLASVQRGYAVYASVCSACHGMEQVHFSDLAGIGLKAEDIQALAATRQIADGLDAQGRVQRRPARPDDRILSPYVSPAAARAAHGGVVPPDLSRIVMVRPGRASRIYGLLTGYAPDAQWQEGKGFRNPYGIANFTAMPPPLHEGAVQYADGTPATVAQQARDVTTFLAWVSAPHQDERRRLGVGAGLYLCFLAALFMILTRRIWSHVRK
ncbi:cytochrome c1 [Acetobacter papayae]|uniref:cytochrome c1 n=1 Tax=Acetobacter papayae TaxID=1076592 RepID=UPI0039EBF9FE